MSDFLTRAGYVKRREETLDTKSTDLFDKIINLKFVRASGDFFVIRSDYEPVYHADGTVDFKPCMYKPQIKVEYKQVANDVAIKVDVEVTNLFMYARNSNVDKAVPTEIYASEGDPVMQIVIQMGYRGQFPDWTDEAHRQPGYTARFFDLENAALETGQEAKVAPRQITVEVLASWPSAYPPDQVSYFKGVIGSVRDGLRWKRTEEESERGFGYENTPAMNPATGSPYTPLEWTFFNYVTRRFVRSDVLHREISEPVISYVDGKPVREYRQRILVHGYKKDMADAALVSDPLEDGTIPDPAWYELKLDEDGLMSESDAGKFGVICRVSRRLREKKEQAYTSYGPEAFAGKLTLLATRRFDYQQGALGSQFVAIKEAYNKIRWYQLADGNFYIYSRDEGDDDFFADPVTLRNQENAIRLPAVYEISIAGLRTIKCPFIAFVSPMTTVLFKSRYSIGSLVGFYYHPGKEDDAFLVLQASISFDTAGDENMMELSCVDIPSPAAPETEGDTAKPRLEVEEPEALEERKPLWTEAQVEAGKDGWTQSFEEIAAHYLEGNSRDPVTNESYWGEGGPGLTRMLTDLKEWNGELFAGYKEGERWKEPLYENRHYRDATVDFPIPNLLPGDIVKYRMPYRPDYPGDEEAS
jgi:hypothetical protein